jgi:carbon-monoxide dehydrogenase medium subunit
MRAFDYQRPTHLDDAIALLGEGGPDARPLAGGTDLIIRLRDGTIRPRVVVDVKGIEELDGEIREGVDGDEEGLTIGAHTVMTDIAADQRIRRDHQALAEAAAVVGAVQIRNRATLAGNICNASPAADTVPALLVFGARVVVAGPAGVRRIPIDEVLVQSGVTTLERGELVTAIELPRPSGPTGSVHVRRTRRRGHDLAAVTLACSVDGAGVTRLAYGSLGPRPLLVVDDTGMLADRSAPDVARMERLEALFVGASPSPRSMRASPEYRLAMLHVLGLRAVGIAIDRLADAAAVRR